MVQLTRTAALTGFIEAARELGLDPYRVAAKVGLPPGALTEPDLRIPSLSLMDLLDLAAKISSVDDFGLRVAERRRLATYGPVGLAARDQPSRRAALELLVRHWWMQSDTPDLLLDEIDDLLILRVKFAGLGIRPTRQIAELAIGSICRAVRSLDSSAWDPDGAYFRHSPPASRERHRRVFGSPVEFGATFDGLAMNIDYLDRPLASSDALMARESQHYLELVAQGHGRSVREWVEELITLLLPTGRFSVDRIAAHLGLDRRTLHRKLAAEGVSYRALLEETRRDAALSLLGDSARSLASIADLTGFSSPSAFSHWFRRAFGSSPREYRSQIA